MKAQRRWIGWLGAVAVVTVGCATRPPVMVSSGQYTRVTRPDDRELVLETACRQFVRRHGSGPVIWLVGVTHVGEARYYRELQALLNAQEIVLFEGVSDQHKKAPGERVADVDPMMDSVAEGLGLVFQLNGIDYRQKNFQHCDLSVSEIRRLLAGTELGEELEEDEEMNDSPGAPVAGLPDSKLDVLLQAMDRRTLPGQLASSFFKIVGADPMARETIKLMLVTVLGAYGNEVLELAGADAEMRRLMDVLLTERNRHVMRQLQLELQKRRPARSVAVFYGAGHLGEVEQRLVEDLGYQPVAERWFTSFSADRTVAGPYGQAMIDSVMAQMKLLKQSAAPKPPEAKGTRP